MFGWLRGQMGGLFGEMGLYYRSCSPERLGAHRWNVQHWGCAFARLLIAGQYFSPPARGRDIPNRAVEIARPLAGGACIYIVVKGRALRAPACFILKGRSKINEIIRRNQAGSRCTKCGGLVPCVGQYGEVRGQGAHGGASLLFLLLDFFNRAGLPLVHGSCTAQHSRSRNS